MPPRKSAPSNFTWEPKSQKQQTLRDTIASHAVTFASGCAGTGKTAAAVYTALEYLDQGKVSRIVVSRPLIEVGRERVGYLPGNLKEKIEPYLTPIDEFLQDYGGYQELVNPKDPGKSRLEAAPIAYMRGRTFSNCFIIIDEASNLTRLQMFTVLTRIGLESKMVLTGDVTQSDLPEPLKNGMTHALGLFAGNPKFGLVEFTTEDILRADIVGDVIKAYAGEKK